MNDKTPSDMTDSPTDTADACMALANRFSYTAHDLRTPLNAILGFAQVLQFEASLSADQRDSLQEIDTAARCLNERLNAAVDMVAEELERIANQASPGSTDNLDH
ncbi:hypothetical protein CFI10_06310 [Marinobacterium iners]|uniref:histidine kinase dimerization/phospho-acceptor domain-containing protein n=1 Tax=Marinobacterium iners TaxID=48076 RepID=UPI001A8C998A|nr:histidine kinase dimerization/phospho-acceptor domain-containing protein [Marinobacterium iners]QSR34606.1 hypothetical protein CFI10_06310 [Marinobacterium iners]